MLRYLKVKPLQNTNTNTYTKCTVRIVKYKVQDKILGRWLSCAATPLVELAKSRRLIRRDLSHAAFPRPSVLPCLISLNYICLLSPPRCLSPDPTPKIYFSSETGRLICLNLNLHRFAFVSNLKQQFTGDILDCP